MHLIISVIARKGGVGKTTIAGNLAGELAEKNRKVGLIDADPQSSLSIWASMGKGFLSGGRVTAATGAGATVIGDDAFLKILEDVKKGCDITLIDTPPGFTEPAVTAAAASDLVLIPCGASPLDLAAARDAIELCRRIRRQRNSGSPVIGLVPSRYLGNSALGRDLPASLAQLGETVLPGVAHRVALPEAAIAGLVIGEHAPNSPAHKEFMELAKAVRRQCNEKHETAQTQAAGIR
jgi:chromosome partitioning protein